MSKKINIAIADDHELVRKGLVSLLREDPNITVVFDVSNGLELLEELKKHPVDVVLLDLEMPVLDGREALKIMGENYPDTNAIILSMHYSNEYIMDCMTHGAKGFLPKNSDIEKLVEAIYQVHENGFFVDSDVSKVLLDHAVKGRKNQEKESEEKLTTREIEIIRLVCDGLLNKEIADKLFLSIRTVEAHRKNIVRKINVNNVAGLIRFAIQNGLYEYTNDSQSPS